MVGASSTSRVASAVAARRAPADQGDPHEPRKEAVGRRGDARPVVRRAHARRRVRLDEPADEAPDLGRRQGRRDRFVRGDQAERRRQGRPRGRRRRAHLRRRLLRPVITPRGEPGPAFGLGLRREHFDALLARPARADFIEVVCDNFMRFGGRPREVLDHVSARHPIVLHGVALSIGSLDPLDARYLDDVARLAERTRARWWSDHLCLSSTRGVEHHELLPLPFTDEAIDHVATRAREARARVGLPFALENPSAYVQWDTRAMDEATFVGRTLEAADCALLLDVNNVFVNATNHGFSAEAYIASLPLERVIQLHMAGHDARGKVLIDTHGEPVCDEVLDLYRFTLTAMRERGLAPPPTLLEWDHTIPPLERVEAEVDRLRAAAAGIWP
ncbi:MAG: DUF692 domain-containing protein [Deltaproteobacteria bacterium]|nr:DUF692 domain-containing protein [Deltaproteobacteria bacterium]